jgi:hypothetical protein
MTDTADTKATGNEANTSSTEQFNAEEIEAMKRRVQEMEQEAAQLREMQAKVVQEMSSEIAEDKEEVDARSVYVGNVSKKRDTFLVRLTYFV